MSEDLREVAERLLESGKIIDQLTAQIESDIVTLATAWSEFYTDGDYINLTDLSYEGVDDHRLGLSFTVTSRGYSWEDYAVVPLDFFLDPEQYKESLEAAVLINADRAKQNQEKQQELTRKNELVMLEKLKEKYEGELSERRSDPS